MKKIVIIGLIVFTFYLCVSYNNSELLQPESEMTNLAMSPPMGWNSFDSYGVYLHEKAAMENLEAFSRKFKPYGYKYFVIDAGWYGEFELKAGTLFPTEKHAKKVNFNEFGLLQPSTTYFPNGLQPIIDRCHKLGLKFGIHLMRGIPRAAVKKNVRIKDTEYFARDIVDTTSICQWNHQNYGVDMSKPGAQEFYNSLINQMAEWEVDFIKYDDLVPYPDEVEAIAKAIKKSGRPIIYSLSPGDKVNTTDVPSFMKANMLRVTPDIWDDQLGIDQCFEAWSKWQGYEQPGFWIDMDMIPFGELQIMAPRPPGVQENETKHEVAKKLEQGALSNIALLAGKGWHRQSKLSKDQMRTFISLRALAASPLMIGGNLPNLDDFSYDLLTNQEMIACNQNGIMGDIIYDNDGIEIWKTDKKNGKGGWIGIFNRSNYTKLGSFTLENLNLDDNKDYRFFDVWNNKNVSYLNFKINKNGVVFLKYYS